MIRLRILFLVLFIGAAGAGAQPHYTDSGPEPLLAGIFDAIEAGHFDAALKQTTLFPYTTLFPIDRKSVV